MAGAKGRSGRKPGRSKKYAAPKNILTRDAAEPGDHMPTWARAIADAVIAESPVAGAATKSLLAETLASLLVQQRRLSELSLAGLITAEEAKTIPSIASGIKRICEALSVTKPRDDDIAFDM